MALHIARNSEAMAIAKTLGINYEEVRIKKYEIVVTSSEVTHVKLNIILTPHQVQQLTKLISEIPPNRI